MSANRKNYASVEKWKMSLIGVIKVKGDKISLGVTIYYRKVY